MRNFADTDNPLAIAISYAVLRERIRGRKEDDEEWPWTSDPLLAGPRSFCNVRREDDRATRWLADNLRTPMAAAGGPEWLAAVVLFRMFNLIATGETFFGGGALSPFAAALAARDVRPLQIALARQPKPHVGGAYTIASLNGYGLNKGEGLLAYYSLWFCDDGPVGWRRQLDYWTRPGVTLTLAGLHAWFSRVAGAGPFVAAQFVADAKYSAPFTTATDWFDWAAPGPGSKMGLNILRGRPIDAPCDDRSWLSGVQEFQRDILNPRLEAIGDPPLHAQDVQNVLCEMSKAWRFQRAGKPATSSKGLRGYCPADDLIPESEAVFEARLAGVYEGDREALTKAGVAPYVAELADLRSDMLAIWRAHQEGVGRGQGGGRAARRPAKMLRPASDGPDLFDGPPEPPMGSPQWIDWARARIDSARQGSKKAPASETPGDGDGESHRSEIA